MPYKGFKSITVREEVYDYFWRLWQENREEYRRRGITSFSGFVTKLLYEMIERFEREGSRSR